MTSLDAQAEHYSNMLCRGTLPPTRSITQKAALAHAANVSYAVTVNGIPVKASASIRGIDLNPRHDQGCVFTALVPASTFATLLWANVTHYRQVDLDADDVVVSFGTVPARVDQEV